MIDQHGIEVDHQHKTITIHECPHCYAILVYRGEGHRCPDISNTEDEGIEDMPYDINYSLNYYKQKQYKIFIL